MEISNPDAVGEARGNRGWLHKGFRRGGDQPESGSVRADPRLEFRLEDGLRRPPDRARECVEVPEALPMFQRVLLQLPDPLADDRVRRSVTRSDDLVRREQLVVDRRPFQARRAVSPFDEVDDVLLPRIDARVADDPQEPDDPPERREELILARDPPEAAPALEGGRKGILLRSGELAGRNLLEDREELEFSLERDAFGNAHERRGDEAQGVRRRSELVRGIRAMHAMAVLLVDEEVEQLARARSRRAPLVCRRKEDFP